MRFEGRWLFCETCQKFCIRCEKCGNISCSGGGCDECYDDFEEAIKMNGRGETPPLDSVPHIPKFDWEGEMKKFRSSNGQEADPTGT